MFIKQKLTCLLLLCVTLPCFTAELTGPLLPASPPPLVSVRAAVLMDAETGTVLFSHNPTLVIAPASLAKLMTIRLVLRAIQTGRAAANDIVNLPPETWADNQPPRSSLMFLGRNQTVTLGEVLLGLAVSSGNDAAVAAALHLAPTMEAFIAMMNAEAGRLGLVSTRFAEPAGVSSENTTTAIDLAKLCRVYVTEDPDSLVLLHSQQSFAYPLTVNIQSGPVRTIVQYNRNNLLGKVEGVDGLKTGYLNDTGFNIALSGRRKETRLIAILLGASTEEVRDRDGEALLEWGFANFRTQHLIANFMPETKIWGSRERYYLLKPQDDLTFTVSASRAGVIQQDIELIPYLKAPLAAGEQAGSLIVSDSMGELRRIPLLLEKDAERGNFFRVILDGIGLLFDKLKSKF